MIKKLLISATLLLALQGTALSDPIQDNSFSTYEAGWFSNTIKGKSLNCQQTCRYNKSVPEYEASAANKTKRTAVCKSTAKRQINLRVSKWLYGNQFDATATCYVTDVAGTASKSEKFHCLCVKPTSCQGPDLIVSFINKPTWDSANHRSVITAEIKNVGNMAAAASIARVIDPSTSQSTGAPYNAISNTPALAPGASAVVTFYLPYWVYNPDAHLEVTADYKGMIKECDETNNMKVFMQQG